MPPSTATTAKPSVEEKILKATEEGATIADIFSPAIGEAIRAGVAAEPLIKGFWQLIAGLFHHHTGVTPVSGK